MSVKVIHYNTCTIDQSFHYKTILLKLHIVYGVELEKHKTFTYIEGFKQLWNAIPETYLGICNWTDDRFVVEAPFK